MLNTCLKEKLQEKEDLHQQIASMKSQLFSSNASLQDLFQTKTEMMASLDSYKGKYVAFIVKLLRYLISYTEGWDFTFQMDHSAKKTI